MNKTLPYISFGLLGLVTAMLMAATVLEKMYGSSFAYEHIYTSPVTILLWTLLAVSGLLTLIRCRTWKQVATFGIHASFILILLGALTTHVTGKQGKLHLRQGEAVHSYIVKDGETGELPFGISLQDFQVECYEGTSAPMDYVSTVLIEDKGESHTGRISMNRPLKWNGYRFYQSGYDRDGLGTSFSISYDPWGIGITYAGYICLLLSMAGFFLQKGSRFRSLIASLCIFASGCTSAEAAPRTLSKEAAEEFGKLYVYHNDRICPMQTLAREFTAKLYGKPSYKGLTAEQVLTGWFFHYDSWKDEPMIKIKGEATRELLGTDGKYARLTDFISSGEYVLDEAMSNGDRNAYAANEKFSLVSMLCTGSLMKIYPHSSDDGLAWYSPGDRLPDEIGYDEWIFIKGSLDLVAEKVAMKDSREVVRLLGKIREYQLAEGGDAMPSEASFKAERIYNSSSCSKPLAMLCLAIGIMAFMVLCIGRERQMKAVRTLLDVIGVCVSIYLTFHIAMRWYISGHIPLSNGFETMQFMAWCSLLTGFCFGKRFRTSRPFGMLICGFALLVSMMGEANPRITQLMPVLQSPLLSIHVMVIMVSYSLFAFMMLNGVAALLIHRKDSSGQVEHLGRISSIMLYPAVFLLAAGIFIGAVWANVSWGRYWGWDPKEVWALITMLIYSLGLHSRSLKWFRKPMHFHIFCILAFLSVIVTYFGVNFILGGMHSYA